MEKSVTYMTVIKKWMKQIKKFYPLKFTKNNCPRNSLINIDNSKNKYNKTNDQCLT